MATEGVDVWGLTPVNEPHGNRGTWESMEMSPEEQAEYVAVLGRVLAERGLDPKLLVYDQNRAEMRAFVEPIFGHGEAGKHAFGAAVHWYDSTFRVFEDELEALHAAWPDRPIVQTEGCIDNVFSHGEFKGPGAATPWWENDAWYWEKVATDWGWDWAPDPEVDHPPYAAAFRYARDLVGCLAHRVSGWVDWNLALNRRGGPNHVENFCLAPLLVDGEQLHVTPLFHVLRADLPLDAARRGRARHEHHASRRALVGRAPGPRRRARAPSLQRDRRPRRGLRGVGGRQRPAPLPRRDSHDRRPRMTRVASPHHLVLHVNRTSHE